MNIDLSEVMLDLQGSPLKEGAKDLTVGMALASILVGGTSPDPLRTYLLGKKIIGIEGETDLDSSEVESLKSAITANTSAVIIKGQLLSKLV